MIKTRENITRLWGKYSLWMIQADLLVLFILLVTTGCEISRSVPLDRPVYKPQLVIQCLASPQSGAEAIIRYNRPLVGENAKIPSLPRMEVYLLREDDRFHTFSQDSTDRFSIAASDLLLEAETDYALEVRDLDNERVYTSGGSRLPDRPVLLSVNAVPVTGYENQYALEINLGPSDHPVEAIAVFPVLLDSMGQPAERLSEWDIQKVTPWKKVSSGIQYVNEEAWSDKKLLYRNSRNYFDEEENVVWANELVVYVSYLSRDLSRFVRDVSDLYFSGEDIFEPSRPVYSNIQNAAGIFGIYNEVRREVKIE